MIRRKPLERHVGLAAGAPLRRVTRLEAGAAPLRRVPLAARSAKRVTVATERRTFVASVLAVRPMCEIRVRCGWHVRPAVELHEPWQRSVGGPWVPSEGLTVDMVWATCRECHDRVHDLGVNCGVGVLADGSPCPWIITSADAAARGWAKTARADR